MPSIPNASIRPEPFGPLGQLNVAARVRSERSVGHSDAEGVDGHGDVDVFVGIDADDDPLGRRCSAGMLVSRLSLLCGLTG